MKEERLSINPQQIDLYIAQAKKMRSEEVSRLFGQLFRLPHRVINRLSSKTDQAIDLDTKPANQPA